MGQIFSHLWDFGYKRTPVQAIGFFIIYTIAIWLISIAAFTLISTIYASYNNIADPDELMRQHGFAASLVIRSGVYTAIALVISLYGAVASKKRFTKRWYALVAFSLPWLIGPLATGFIAWLTTKDIEASNDPS